MRIVKPLRLTLMYRPFRWRTRKGLAVTIVACLKKQKDTWQAIPEITLMKDILPLLDADEILDFIMPKPHPEFLVSGNAYTAHQEDKTKCMVKVRVGKKEKQCLVFGDRYWIDNKITPPAEYSSQPMDWAYSYGGPGFPDNPVGQGIAAVQQETGSVHKLPNLESPTDRIHSRGRHVPPINFGPVHIDWPARMGKAGTFDDTWLKTEGTGFFDDLDPLMFNAASEDQIWLDRTELKLDETFEIWNMHPTEPIWQGTLPSVRARCFVRQRTRPADAMQEISMSATTAWFVPDQDCLLLMFHGAMDIQEDDAYDIASIMPALEHLNHPRSAAHYQSIFEQRTDPEKGALYAFRDEDLIPEDMKAPWLELESMENHHTMLAKMSRMQYSAYDDEAGENWNRFVGPIKPMRLGDLPELVERSQQLREQALQEHEQYRNETLQQIRDEKKKGGPYMPAEMLDSLEDMLKGETGAGSAPQLPMVGPPRMRNVRNLVPAENRALLNLTQMQSAFADTLGQEQSGINPADALHKFYLYSVQYQKGAPRVGEHKAMLLRREVKKRVQAGQPLKELDLTGADLSNMDLRNANFDHAWLEAANLARADLSGATFNEAVLARADFSEAAIDQAVLSGANISEAIFYKTRALGAKFSDVIIEGSITLASSVFDESEFSSISVEAITIESCSFRKAVLTDCNLNGATITHTDFSGASIIKGGIDKATLEHLQLDQTILKNCIVTETSIRSSHMHQCTFVKVTFFGQCRMEKCSIRQSEFAQCAFREMKFSLVDFSGSVFNQCDFTLAHIQECRLVKISSPQSLFVRTFFDASDMSGSNLMTGNFQKSVFQNTVLDHCNFFRADLSEILVDETTTTDNLYLEGARLAPYHESVTPTWRSR